MKLQLDGLTDVFDENKVNNGVWVHLEGLDTDDNGDTVLLYLDEEKTKPQRVLVRSNRCKLIIDLEKRAQRDGFVKIQKAKKADKADATASMITTPEQRFPLLLVAVDNMSKSTPGVQYVDEDDAKTIFATVAFSGLVQQVQAAAAEDDLFRMGSPSEAGGEDEGGPQSSKTSKKTTTSKDS